MDIDIVGRWTYNQEHWNSDDTLYREKQKYFRNSLYWSYFGLSQFELFINKIKLDDDDENLLFLLKAPRQPLAEEKISLTKLNISGQDAHSSLTSIQNYDSKSNHFNILRLGPKPTESCAEYYRFDSLGRLHVIFLTFDEKGNRVTLSRSFERVEDPASLQREKVRLFTTGKTRGWNEIVSCPNQIVELVQVRIVKVERYQDGLNEREVLYAPDLTLEQKQSLSFGEAFHHYQHTFHFQV